MIRAAAAFARTRGHLLVAVALVSILFVLAPLGARRWVLFGIPEETLHVLGHVLVYATVGWLLGKAMRGAYGWAWLVCVGVSLAEELHQAFVPGRCVDAKDMLINVAAVTAGVALAAVLGR